MYRVTAYLASANQEHYWLTIRCNVNPNAPNIPEIYIDWDSFIEDEYPDVAFRLDDGEVFVLPWIASLDQTVTFFPGADIGNRQFIWQLMNSDRLATRLHTDYIHTGTFEVRGLAEALLPFKDSCDWVAFETAEATHYWLMPEPGGQMRSCEVAMSGLNTT